MPSIKVEKKKKKGGMCQALLQHGHRGGPFALAEVASESLWQSSTLAPREQDQAT